MGILGGILEGAGTGAAEGAGTGAAAEGAGSAAAGSAASAGEGGLLNTIGGGIPGLLQSAQSGQQGGTGSSESKGGLPPVIQSVLDKLRAAEELHRKTISTAEKLGHMGVGMDSIGGTPASMAPPDMTQYQGQQGAIPQLQAAVQQMQGPNLNFGSGSVNKLLEAARGNFR